MLHTFLLSFLCLAYLGNPNTEPNTPKFDSPILVELFTSQGCSSCPPADQIVADLVQNPDLNIIALSFHVDYWNRLGWRDPYSQAAFSQRQYQYAEKLSNNRRVYTPQIVINGQSGHIGSRRQEVKASIQKAAALKKAFDFDINSSSKDAQSATLNIDASNVPDDYDLVICLVDAQVKNEVPRGENRGRNLAHVQVVRSLQKVATPSSKSINLDLSILDYPKAGKVVAFLQHKKTWRIAGVKEIQLPL